jgi:phosphatidylethanolamine/phosphatidyl-N-methylethanolamine N-methyltransferase
MTFLKQTILKPKYTGAVARSSNKLAELITNKANLEHAGVVVELGPGTGVFTKEIVKKINNKSLFFTIEINKFFANEMRLRYPKVKTINGSAENLSLYLNNHGVKETDRVISGLPWTVFGDRLQNKLLSEISRSLKTGGLFLTFSYYPLNYLPRGKSFNLKLSKYFKYVDKTKVVLGNLPPAFVYICEK